MKDESLSREDCKNCGKKITREGKRQFCSYECLYAYCRKNRKKYRATFLEKKRRENV